MSAHEYTEEQMEHLADLAPQLMETLLQIKDTPRVPFSIDPAVHAQLTIERMSVLALRMFREMDRYCWHVPQCAVGEVCYGGEPNEAERVETEKRRKADDEARREDFEP